LAALISSWLVYYYQPDQSIVERGHTVFIPQGAVFLGLTILGLITAFGRVFDAVSDPLIASASDRCNSRDGRRIPFMRMAAIPFALVTVLVFWSPVNQTSWINAVVLFLMLTLFYFFMTMYCTPYNALIPELGQDQATRMGISTCISFTYIAGMALAYLAPTIWGLLEAPLGRITAIRVTVTGMALIGLACMFVPVFTIRERDYIDVMPSNGTAMRSLVKTFRNRDFRIFVASDVAYFVGLTMFQTALPYFVTALLHLEESMSTVYFVLMTALSVVFYLPINKLAPKLGKKKLILIAFTIFTVCFGYTALFGSPLGIPAAAQGYILCVAAAPAMAIFGILPQAVVADIAESDALETHENRSGMFYAARTFAFKLGQSLALLLFTAIAKFRQDIGLGYRISAIVAAAFCVIGGVVFLLYNEKKIYASILTHGASEGGADAGESDEGKQA
jgi:Na+/melibiose symporter-like transporter